MQTANKDYRAGVLQCPSTAKFCRRTRSKQQGLQEKCNAVYDEIKKGVDKEAAATVDNAKSLQRLYRVHWKKSISKKSESTPEIGGHTGACAFLNTRLVEEDE